MLLRRLTAMSYQFVQFLAYGWFALVRGFFQILYSSSSDDVMLRMTPTEDLLCIFCVTLQYYYCPICRKDTVFAMQKHLLISSNAIIVYMLDINLH